MEFEKMKKEVEALRPKHAPEALMEQAKEAIDKILPEGMHELFYRPVEHRDVQDAGSALCGGVFLLGPANHDAMSDLIGCALELTCQAIVAEKWKEAEEKK